MKEIVNIQNDNGNLFVNSRDVARDFEKEHKNVLRDIDGYISILKNGESSNMSSLFIESKYTTEEANGVYYREYNLTRDGFTILAMGFTGEKALIWKLKYIEAFNKMENALKEIYHVSEAALVNNVIEKVLPAIDDRMGKYEDNYRPTHSNKIKINDYIKKGLGELREEGEVNLVKERVLIMLNGEKWQDIPFSRLVENMNIIDESIIAVKNFRTKRQLTMFNK